MDSRIKLGIMQPYFFPYIGFFQLLNAVDKYVVFDDVNFINKGWINRNYILSNGAKIPINLLLSKASQNKHINELTVIHDAHHKKKLLRSIEMNYGKAPYFNDAYPVIKGIISNSESALGLYLFDQLKTLCGYMQITTQLLLSSEIDKDVSLKGEDKILEICGILNAGAYYNAIGGTALYSKERFAENGLELRFLKTDEDLEYKQFDGAFVSNLSIIDVMMFNSVEEIRSLLDKFTLI